MKVELETQLACSVQSWEEVSKEKSFVQLPRAILVHLLTDKNLSQTDKFVWLFLSTYTFTNPKTRELSFSSSQIGKGIGRSGPTVTASLKTLSKTGYIKLENPLRADKSYSKHKITVLFPSSAIQQIQSNQQNKKGIAIPTPTEKKSTISNNALPNPTQVVFWPEFRFSVKGYQISERGYRNFEIINNKLPTGSSLINNNVNTVTGNPGKNDIKLPSLPEQITQVENVFLDKTNSHSNEEEYDFSRAQEVNAIFRERYQNYCAKGSSLEEAMKLADKELSDEDRLTLTKAACLSNVRYEVFRNKNILEDFSIAESELKAQTSLSVLEQDLLAEYFCEDLNYQTRLNRSLIDPLTAEFRGRFNGQNNCLSKTHKNNNQKNAQVVLAAVVRSEEKLFTAESIYKKHENLYQEKLGEGMIDGEAKEYTRKNLNQSDKKLLLEISEAINYQYARTLEGLSPKMSYSSKDAEAKKQLSSVQQVLLNEYLLGPQHTLLGLSAMKKQAKYLTEEEEKPLAIIEMPVDSTDLKSEIRENIDTDILGRIIGWLFVMKKKGEVPKSTSDKQMKRLIEEVAYHAIHWKPTHEKYKNLEKREKMKVAISFACRSIREGTWKTPYGLLTREIIQREIQANYWKEKELDCIKKRVKNF